MTLLSCRQYLRVEPDHSHMFEYYISQYVLVYIKYVCTCSQCFYDAVSLKEVRQQLAAKLPCLAQACSEPLGLLTLCDIPIGK